MKKLLTTSIATLGILSFGIAHHEADAAEQTIEGNQNSQLTTGYANGSYYTIDQNGNYHHTLDGNWNQSMFDNKEYTSYQVDENGVYHYYYFAIDDNDYIPSQSDDAINQNGYQTEANQDDTSNQTNTNNEASADVNNQNNASQANTNQTNANNQVAQENNQNAQPATNNTDAQASNESSEGKAQTSSEWLTKHPKFQEYGQYHGGGAHYGVDYGMKENTPVYSLADGTVIQSGWSNYGGGNQVTIKEKNSDYYQWYMHMNKLNVQKGQEVKAGQQIGQSGSTGNSTAPHLHFQRMKGGVGNQYAVNPESYVNNR
ncbi:M23 family metallopeptidase [Mammaliicoccus stepanovicii]|uniref:lysostaphin n=1 Tax=Mammaliicoccus stepanovicii TaxID=643214 RepID=A0A239Y7Q8_9STAP|nr:M23 family metallopeptidase [Mammaliicoccus stepanovicii]PNZ77053.1 peptidase M23 [Mammaliicoccus stepanovicii]GGI43002.1 glycyl-glycine endopeptidase LytM [Mammaliicoccus stepanovicii]SNV55199.1 peptidoglycan hydrolase [Mammaliicoccus stepanovicii]